MSQGINYKNIKSFITGNLNFYLSKIIDYPIHLKEQYYYRLYKCKDTCLATGKCQKCNCPTIKKAYAVESCNPELFPDFMSGQDWRLYKMKNHITNIEEIIKEVENDIHKRNL